MRSTGLGLLAAFLCLALLGSPAWAERRIGLVIGIDRYPALPQGAQLVKAVADARAVRDLLKGPLRFHEVVFGENTSLAQTRELLLSFSKKLQPGDLAFVFFAGHGMNVRLGNYLLPSDLPALRDVTTEAQVRLEEESMVERSIPEERMRELISLAGARTAIIVLDACRNNIFREALAAGGPRTRTLANATQVQGARPVERPAAPGRTQFITLYSASPGQRALDNLGPSDQHPNSPFTRVLVSNLVQPGMRVYEVLRGLRAEVVRLAASAGHDQVPAIADEALEDVVLVAGAADVASTPAARVSAPAAPPSTPAPPASAPPVAAAPAPSAKPPRASASPPTPPLALITPTPEPAPVPGSTGAPGNWAGWRLAIKGDARARVGISNHATSADFARIAASYRDKTLRLWSVESGLQTGLIGGVEPQSGLAFHPAGALLAGFGDRDAISVTVWDVRTLKTVYQLAAGPEPINSIGFTEDGASLVLRDRRGAVRAFDVASRQERVATPVDAAVFQDRRRSTRPPVSVSTAGDTLRVSRGGRGSDSMQLRALADGDWVSIAEDGLTFTGSKAAVAGMELLKGRDRLTVTDQFIADYYRADGLRR
jgi:uncharacterized caspase-like protein